MSTCILCYRLNEFRFLYEHQGDKTAIVVRTRLRPLCVVALRFDFSKKTRTFAQQGEDPSTHVALDPGSARDDVFVFRVSTAPVPKTTAARLFLVVFFLLLDTSWLFARGGMIH